MQNLYDLTIIGAGPAGIACGIAAQKAGLNYVILEKEYLVNSLYNFPVNMTFFSTSQKLEIGDTPFISHNEKPTRKEALEYYRRIVRSYNLNIEYGCKVESVSQTETFNLKCKDQTISSDFVIVATGYYDNPRTMGVEGESLNKVKHYYDDAHPYIGKKVLVVGAANSACDVALETWQKDADVTMVIRKNHLYPKVKYWILPNIQNRIEEGSIKAYFNSTIQRIEEKHVVLKTENGNVRIENDFVLAMTGYKPDYNFLESLGISFENNTVKKPLLNTSSLESNIENLYVAGVIVSGMNTSELFIENTRHHGQKIVSDIVKKKRKG